MLNQVVNFIREALRPYNDEIAELVARIEELERCKDNIIKPGKVTAVHPGGQLIKVAYDNNSTPWIKWIAAAAGEVSEYRCPSVGEQCALLNYGGGEDSAQAWALCGVPSDIFPLPGSTPGIRVVSYPGGMKEKFDSTSGEVVVTAPSKATFAAPELHGTGEVSDSVRTMSGDRAIYDGHTHTDTAGTGAGTTSDPHQKQG